MDREELLERFRVFNERGERGMRKTLKPAISGNPSAASADTRARTAAGTDCVTDFFAQDKAPLLLA